MIIISCNKQSLKFRYQVSLTLITRISLSKRFMLSTAAHSTKVLQDKLLANKLVFLHFCNHFKNIPLTQLMNDHLFIQWVYKSNHGTPTLQSRAFQLALEVTYNKRHFSQKALEEYYKNDFQIQDVFKVNNGLCEQSTIYSSTLAKYVSFYFNLESKDLIVNSTPTFLTKEKITPEIKSIMESNKKLTDNSMPDIEIKNRPYDFKESKDISWNKNHVYLLDAENFRRHGQSMLKNLEQSLHNQIHTNTSLLSEEAKKYALSIQNILKNKEAPVQEIFENIYKFTLTHQPPKDFRIPYLIPIKKANSQELLQQNKFTHDEIANVHLKEGHLTDVKAKKAIESIQDAWDPTMKEKVQKAISSSLSHVLSNQDESS